MPQAPGVRPSWIRSFFIGLPTELSRTRSLFIISLLLLAGIASGQDAATITVDLDHVRHTAVRGIGASWHAASEDSIDMGAEYTRAERTINARGSAWGGNPPIADTAAWLGGRWRPDAWQHVLSVERERRLVALQSDRG